MLTGLHLWHVGWHVVSLKTGLQEVRLPTKKSSRPPGEQRPIHLALKGKFHWCTASISQQCGLPPLLGSWSSTLSQCGIMSNERAMHESCMIVGAIWTIVIEWPCFVQRWLSMERVLTYAAKPSNSHGWAFLEFVFIGLCFIMLYQAMAHKWRIKLMHKQRAVGR